MLNAELWDISQALKIVLKKTTLRKAGRITVYLNIQMAIKQFYKTKKKTNQVLRIQIYE